jgi:hypothetical protein
MALLAGFGNYLEASTSQKSRRNEAIRYDV